jgi:hypothetical protein
MSGLSIHSAAQNSKFLVQIKSSRSITAADQLSLLRSLLSEDPKLVNAVDIVHSSNLNKFVLNSTERFTHRMIERLSIGQHLLVPLTSRALLMIKRLK